MIDFLNTNAGAIQSIMVIVLATITAVYVWDTRRLANISTKQLDLFIRPVTVVGESIGIIVQHDPVNINLPAALTDWVRFKYTIRNIGNVAVKYNAYTSFNGHQTKSEHEAILYPGQILTHRTENYTINSVHPKQIKGIASIRIEYWSLDFPSDKKFFSRKFEIKENAEGYDIIEDMAGNVKN
jgi:hypothetical protein